MCCITGYSVLSTEAEIRLICRITIVWREETVWQVEDAKKYRLDVSSLTIMLGWNHWYVVGSHMPPND